MKKFFSGLKIKEAGYWRVGGFIVQYTAEGRLELWSADNETTQIACDYSEEFLLFFREKVLKPPSYLPYNFTFKDVR